MVVFCRVTFSSPRSAAHFLVANESGRVFCWVPNLGYWCWNEGIQDDWQWDQEGQYIEVPTADVLALASAWPPFEEEDWGWLLEQWRQAPDSEKRTSQQLGIHSP